MFAVQTRSTWSTRQGYVVAGSTQGAEPRSDRTRLGRVLRTDTDRTVQVPLTRVLCAAGSSQEELRS